MAVRGGSGVVVRALAASLALATGACGDDGGGGGGGSADAGADGGRDGSVASDFVTPPDIPWLAAGAPPIAPPVLTPCPTGWREIAPATAGGVTTCDPYPESGAADCPFGQAHFPGEPGCTVVGSPCPAGEWADGLADDGSVVFVRAGATGGDGTRAMPFATVAEALAVAVDGDTIALAKGRYDEVIRVWTAGVTVRGACTAETVLTAQADGIVLRVRAPRVVLRDFSIADSPVGGLLVQEDGSEATVDGIVVSNVTGVGVYTNFGGVLRGQSLVIQGTRPMADGTFGRNLIVQGGSRVDLSRVVVAHGHETAVFVGETGSELVLRDAVIRDTAAQLSDGEAGNGLVVLYSASTTVQRVVLERNRETAVLVAMSGTRLAGTDLVVRDTESKMNDGTHGAALTVYNGAVADVSRATLDRNRTFAAQVALPGARLSLSDVVIRDTQGQESDEGMGVGIHVSMEGEVDVSRGVLERNRTLGVFATGEGVRAVFTDVVVRDTREGSLGLGYAVGAIAGATVEMSRAVLENNVEIGAQAYSAGTTLRMSDVVVRHTQPNADGMHGRGIEIDEGAVGDVSRALFERNREASVLASSGGAHLTMTDAVVRDTESANDVSSSGHGIGATLAATVVLTRVEVARSREGAVVAYEAGASIVMNDVAIFDTLPRACATTTCVEAGGGIGAASLLGGSLVATRFAIHGSAQCGIMVAREGQMDLSTGEIVANRFGACVQIAGYDVGRLMNGVTYRDNETNLDATTFPLPQGAMPMPGM